MGWKLRAAAAVVMTAQLMTMQVPGSQAADYVPLNGAGSTWASNFIEQSAAEVRNFGLPVGYLPSGSGDGRAQFKNRTVDFGVTDEPFETGEAVPAFGYQHIPIAAGATALMYNLRIGAKQVTNLRLTPDLVAGIFTGELTSWGDPAIAARNPGLKLPAIPIVPVVRADSSGTSQQFSGWLKAVAPQRWSRYCVAAGRSDCGATANYPVVAGGGMVAQSGSLGVSGYVAQTSAAGAITYVQNSYARNVQFPVAQLLNASGTYVTPTSGSAGIALLQAKMTVNPSAPGFPASVLSGVWSAKDPRAYPLSSYSYLLAPTEISGPFTAAKALSLSTFVQFMLCQGQASSAEALGYTPMPVNLVKDALARLATTPGSDPASLTLAKCANPTFTPAGKDTLTTTVPQPPDCARIGPGQCGSAVPRVPVVAGPITYPAGASATRHLGPAADSCAAPTLAALTAWTASPYRALAVHLGGVNRECAQPQLTAAWVARATALGWRLLPVYDGREAPCTSRTGSRINPATASRQGADAATDAIRATAALGLRPGSIVYASVGAYASGDAACRSAVLAFVSGFTAQAHARGYLSGVRADTGSGVRDLAAAYRTSGFARPDAVWVTDPATTAPGDTPAARTGIDGLSDEAWSNHQRVRQDGGAHAESYGGTTLTITRHQVDAPVATVARTYTAASGTTARSAPATSAKAAASIRRGSALAIVCQTQGTKTRATVVWNQLASGAYVSDAFVGAAPATGWRPELPRCSYPVQVLSEDGVAAASSPAQAAANRRGLFSGALAWIWCQREGSTAGGSKVWDRLDTGAYVPDAYLAARGRPGVTKPMPSCL